MTDFGLLQMSQAGSKVEGRYRKNGTLEGKVKGKTLSFTYRESDERDEGSFELAKSGDAFKGKWQTGKSSGNWRGWKKDPKAESYKTTKFAGAWLSSWGTFVLEQTGKKVTGTYGSEGWSTVQGEVRGRRLHMTWKRLQSPGEAWIEMTKDGKRFFGMAEGVSRTCLGLRLEGSEEKVNPKSGNIVQGLSTNHMCYFLRAPPRWKKNKKTDAIVLLHGSNWTTKGMVSVTAKNWPDLGKKFMVIGIQGQNWATWSDLEDLRHNYTYVNWMGRSTYGGYPNTHRESHALVAEVIEELKERHNLGRIFVGGHSQGGFLAFILAMHFPEKLAGVFPMSGGLVLQAEPDVFDNEKLLEAQRATPMAIIHGTRDNVVSFSMGQYCYNIFESSGFPRLRFLTPNRGHGYDFLPVGEAVEWLDALSTTSPAELLDFARRRSQEKEWRDVSAALLRAKELKVESKFKKIASRLNDAAKKEAKQHLKSIQKNKNSAWTDSFLSWREQFEFAPAAKEVMKAFGKLRKKHDKKAETLIIDKAREKFRAGDRDGGYRNYEKIIDKYYAAGATRSSSAGSPSAINACYSFQTGKKFKKLKSSG